MKIRKAKQEDAPGISRILHALNWNEHLREEPIQELEQRVKEHLELCNKDDSHSLFVAENSDGKVIGYAAVHWLPYFILKGPEGYLSELFVANSERGKGVGSQLLEVVKEEAMNRGCSRLSLINIKRRESYRRGFYNKCGWIERNDAANFVFQL